jgi:hypothetical protein
LRKKQAMGNNGRQKNMQGLWVGILVTALVICVWLFPVGTGIAASGSSDFSVSVTVQDSVSVEVGDNVLDMAGNEEVDIRIVTRMGSENMAGTGDGESYSEMIVTASRL